MNIVFLPPAEQELAETVDYYEAQKPGLGFEFFEEIWATIERIDRHPDAWQSVSRNVLPERTYEQNRT